MRYEFTVLARSKEEYFSNWYEDTIVIYAPSEREAKKALKAKLEDRFFSISRVSRMSVKR